MSKGKVYRVDIPSLADLAATVSTTKQGERSREAQSEFFGRETFEQAQELARHGWREGAERAKRTLESLDLPPVQTLHSSTFNDVTGAFVDVGEYVQGTPECMVDFATDTRTARFAHIVVSGVYSAGFDKDDATRRGIAIAAVVDALEARGIRCAVDLITPIAENLQKGADRLEFHHRLKEESAPLNLETLVFAIAHPAYFRRMIFAMMELHPERNKFGVGRGYGSVVDLPEIANAILFPTPRMYGDWSVKKTRERVTEILRTFAEAQS